MDKRSKQVESFVKKALRRASLKWPDRNEAIKNARVSRGMYKCSHCKKESFGPKDGNLDHIQPVQPIGVEIDLITWIYRLLCDVSNWQWLCKNCHDNKTLHENLLREVKKVNNKKKKLTSSKKSAKIGK